MLPKDVYEKLEEAMGPGNVFREPALLDGYAWQLSFNTDPDIWIPRLEAVVLPTGDLLRPIKEEEMAEPIASRIWTVSESPN